MKNFRDEIIDRLLDAERRLALLDSQPEEIAATAGVINVNAETLLDVAIALRKIVDDDEQERLVARLLRGLDSIYFLSGRIHEMAWEIKSSSPETAISERDMSSADADIVKPSGEEPPLSDTHISIEGGGK